MKDRINEFFVRLKYNKVIEALEAIFIIGFAALVIGAFSRENLRTPALIFFLLSIFFLLLADVVRSLKRYDDDVIRKNKKVNIIFSVRKTVTDYVFWGIYLGIILLDKILGGMDWPALVPALVVALAIVFNIPKYICKHFKNKIVQ